jgi:hypothetical protein
MKVHDSWGFWLFGLSGVLGKHIFVIVVRRGVVCSFWIHDCTCERVNT